MRVLFVAPYLPTPGSGGRTRLANVMRRVAEHNEVELVAFREADQVDAAVDYRGSILPPRPIRRPRNALRFYLERLDPQPQFVVQLRDPAMTAAIQERVAAFRPDVVQVETTEMAQYLTAVPAGTLRALDLQDIASRWFYRVSRATAGAKRKGLLWLEYMKTRRYDMRQPRLADVVFVASDVERTHLGALAGIEPVLVPNGVDTAEFAPRDAPKSSDTVLFVGPMSYVANLEGMRWFAREVYPRLENTTVELVGTPAPEAWPAGFTAHGRVDDVRGFYARAPVSIVPVLFGSGTRYKILEALSMARAVVSTTVGAEGLGVRDDKHLLLADEPEAFAAAINRAMRDPALRARLGAEGREFVVERYDWGPLVARMEAAWSSALERRRATTSEL